MRLTVEEMSLLQAMEHTCRKMAICDIKANLPDIEDHELRELCEKVLQKVENMTEADFAAIDFSKDEEENNE